MTAANRARFRLRETTRPDHERVDAAFAQFELGHRAGYAAFLHAQADAFLPVEAGVDMADPAFALPDWAARRRGALVIADLADLAVTVEPMADVPRFDSRAAMLGAVYVLEGSRLGGRMLARSVGVGLPRRFVDAEDEGRWQKLVAVLDEALQAEDRLAAAVDAARKVFARFEKSARRLGEPACP